MREIETLIQRKELQNKIECFTRAGLTKRAVALKGQLAPEAVDCGRAGESDEAISGVYLSESGEASVGDGASERETVLFGNQVTCSKVPVPSFEPWEIDNILSRAYRWFISIPSADRIRKRFRNVLLEKLLVLGESFSIDGEVLERVRNELREHSEGLEWRDWYWLLFHRIDEKVARDRLGGDSIK